MNNVIFLTERKNGHRIVRKGEFVEFIRKQSKAKEGPNNSIERDRVLRKELANRLGVKYCTLKHILNQSRPTSRDFIIAMCSQLQLDPELTDEALFLNHMPVLKNDISREGEEDTYGSYYARDDAIIAILEECSKNHMSVAQINSRLINEGFNPLDSSYFPHPQKPRYKIINSKTAINLENALFDRFDSLDTQYSIDMYLFISEMLIFDEELNRFFLLSMSSDGIKNIHKITEKEYMIPIVYDYDKHKSLELDSYFELLNNMIQKERHKIYLQLDDTKNYYKRVSAKYIEGEIHIFAEMFNTFVPELNEYFFVDYCKGEYLYCVSKKSYFLCHKLGMEEYLKEFRIINPKGKLVTQDENEIEALYTRKTPFCQKELLMACMDSFKQLKSLVVETKVKLQNREYYIFNVNSIFGGPNIEYDTCKHLKVDKYFDFKIEKDSYGEELYIKSKDYTIINYNERAIRITIEDVKLAAELGMKSLYDMCDALLRYNSLDEIINDI